MVDTCTALAVLFWAALTLAPSNHNPAMSLPPPQPQRKNTSDMERGEASSPAAKTATMAETEGPAPALGARVTTQDSIAPQGLLRRLTTGLMTPRKSEWCGV